MDFEEIMSVVLITLGLVVLGLLVGVLLMLPTMWLWNWLMPSLFHLPTITIWQAWGLNVLCSLLFKSNIITKK